MSFFGNHQPQQAAYKAPSSSSSRHSSESYDYSGWDDYQKKKEELEPLQAQKYSQLYGGDVPGSVTTSQRIRYLQDLLSNYPTPLVRVSSESSSDSSSADGPQYEYTNPSTQVPVPANNREGGDPGDVGRELDQNEQQDARRRRAQQQGQK